jgi:hypothetical protein
MKYYHLSLQYEKMIEEFIPRIPKGVLYEEDRRTPRICVSNSIEGCFLAHPCFREIFADEIVCELDLPDGRYDQDDCEHYYASKEFGYFFRVYEFDINEEDNVINNDELIAKSLVPDASETGEAWILNNRKPDRWYNIIVYNPFDIIDNACGEIMDNAEYKSIGHFMPDEIKEICEHEQEELEALSA